MSEHMKKLHTSNNIEVVVHDKKDMKFIIPRSSAREILALLKPFQVSKNKKDLVHARQVFSDLYEQHGKIGATIRGCRVRDGMTQVELAKKLNIHQAHISQMEHGKRIVGKKMAQKLAVIFKTDYRLFL